MNEPSDLRAALGSMDVYLVDQLLRGRIREGGEVFDAGCGRGRNVGWFLRAGYPVRGIDADPDAVAGTRELARTLAGSEAAEGFRCLPLEDLAGEGSAQLVICNAVLHFARSPKHFYAMLRGAWSALAPGGLFFCRLATSIGLEGAEPLDAGSPAGRGRHRLPDGSERFLLDREELGHWTRALGGRLLDPIKTTLVEDLRAMTTWVMQRETS